MALSLTSPPESRNIAILAQWQQEEFTGLTTTTVPLSSAPDTTSGMCLVFKNGTLVRPSLITISGSTLTLPSALVAGDWIVIFYKARLT